MTLPVVTDKNMDKPITDKAHRPGVLKEGFVERGREVHNEREWGGLGENELKLEGEVVGSKITRR